MEDVTHLLRPHPCSLHIMALPLRLSAHCSCSACAEVCRAMHVQLRDADVASAELVEEKRLSRELSSQVQEFLKGRCPSSSRAPHTVGCNYR